MGGRAFPRCAAPTLLDELRDFDFDAYPAHVKDLHCYAWKPLILAQLRREFPDEGLVWLDSGVQLLGPMSSSGHDGFLERAVAAAKAQGGVISDKTSGTVEQWTHPGMFEYVEKKWSFRKDFFVGQDERSLVNNCNGAFSAWAPLRSPTGAASVGKGTHAMSMWETCALDKKCMCPPGSSRGNHRQDQAALTLVLATLGFR